MKFTANHIATGKNTKTLADFAKDLYPEKYASEETEVKTASAEEVTKVAEAEEDVEEDATEEVVESATETEEETEGEADKTADAESETETESEEETTDKTAGELPQALKDDDSDKDDDTKECTASTSQFVKVASLTDEAKAPLMIRLAKANIEKMGKEVTASYVKSYFGSIKLANLNEKSKSSFLTYWKGIFDAEYAEDMAADK